MRSGFRYCFLFCLLGDLLLRPPGPAAACSAAVSPTSQPAAAPPAADLPPPSEAPTPRASDASLTQLQPVSLTRVPACRTARPAGLAVETPPGAEGSGQRVRKGMDRDTEFALAVVGIGAGVGLTFGLINGHDEGRNMRIGACVGAGLIAAAYALALGGMTTHLSVPPSLADAATESPGSPAFRAPWPRPEGLWLLGERLDSGKDRSPARMLGRAALGLAAAWADGGRARVGFPLVYAKRW